MVTVNGHFDGKAIVPDEPLSLPAGTRLKVSVEPVAEDRPASAGSRAAAWSAWVADMREWGARNLPAGQVVNDDRDGIYEGRGE